MGCPDPPKPSVLLNRAQNAQFQKRSSVLNKREFLRSFAQIMGVCAVTPLISQPVFAATETGSFADALAPAASKLKRLTWPYNVFRAAGYGSYCTSYALDRMYGATGQWMKVRGNAYKWADEARAAYWTVGAKPEIKSVLVMPSPPGYRYQIRRTDGVAYNTILPALGHVAWVEQVNGEWVYVRDRNWKRGQIDTRWIKVAGSPASFIYSSH
jgi:surface antigen